MTRGDATPTRDEGPAKLARSARLSVAAVVEETPEARSLVFDVPEVIAPQFAYAPGQFLTLRVPHESAELARCYSLGQ